MDPQQMMLLEVGAGALTSASLDRSSLQGGLMGVFVGIAQHDHAGIEQRLSAFSATASNHAIASGRISYVFGLHGPCISYDTACSSALTANHAALRTTEHVESDGGPAACVNLLLLPRVGARGPRTASQSAPAPSVSSNAGVSPVPAQTKRRRFGLMFKIFCLPLFVRFIRHRKGKTT